jgi:hypothetical protein
MRPSGEPLRITWLSYGLKSANPVSYRFMPVVMIAQFRAVFFKLTSAQPAVKETDGKASGLSLWVFYSHSLLSVFSPFRFRIFKNIVNCHAVTLI